ncbi:hypothetical protein MMC16_004219 [Acarospora aff. strigata]|nr:hypothetical protein [Acarospora aff. strigata]
MSMTTPLNLSTTDSYPDNPPASHIVLSSSLSPSTPIEPRIHDFESQTSKSRAAARLPSSHGNSIHLDPNRPNHSEGKNDDSGLVSPSTTPPSAYRKLHRTPLRKLVSSPPAYRPRPRTRSQRETGTYTYGTPENLGWGVPPISPASIPPRTFASTKSAVEYLLNSAASNYSHSPPSSPEERALSASASPSPPGRQAQAVPSTSHFVSNLDLDNAEEDAVAALFTLASDNGKRPAELPPAPRDQIPPSPAPLRDHHHPTSPIIDPSNALSSLPETHSAKFSCAFALLALHKECVHDEEVRYRRLLIERDLTGDEDLYEDADTEVDEGEQGEARMENGGGMSGRSSTISPSPPPIPAPAVSFSKSDRYSRITRRNQTLDHTQCSLTTSKSNTTPPTISNSNSKVPNNNSTPPLNLTTTTTATARKTLITKSKSKAKGKGKRKTKKAPNTPKTRSPSLSPSVRSQKWSAGYRRERGRKRGGTATAGSIE